ncbi:MAG: SigB/SigF/SigG family RNA polymerase sigma factor [Nocardioidaceae bacterium]
MTPRAFASQLSGYLHASGLEEHHARSRATRTHDLLSRAQQAPPGQRERILDDVILLNVEVAESIVLRYRNRGVAYDDLVQIACLGLVKAVHGYDPARSDNFLGYAVPTIRGEIRRFFRDNAWVVRPPRRIQELQSQITSMRERLCQANGHPPTAEELAAALDVAVADVDEALAADGCYTPSSLDRAATGDDTPTTTLAGLIGSDDGTFDSAEARMVLRPLCQQLSRREQKIVYLRFFNEWTQARIAQEFGITQMQVSRLLSRILSQLRSQVGSYELHTAADGHTANGGHPAAGGEHAHLPTAG